MAIKITRVQPGTEGIDLKSGSAKAVKIREKIPEALPEDGSGVSIHYVCEWFKRHGLKNGPRLSTTLNVRVGIELSQLSRAGRIRKLARGLYARRID